MKFSFGWGEIAGIAQRGDYDLRAHFGDKFRGKVEVIEPTTSLERLILAVLVDGYYESDGSDGRKKGERVLKILPALAPVKAAVFPLIRKPELIKLAKKIFQKLSQDFQAEYDEKGSIGRRYRRQDEIGTPFCVTVDFKSLKNQTITVRNRDTLKQVRIKIEELTKYLDRSMGIDYWVKKN